MRIFAYGKDREVCTQCEADMLASLKRCGLVTFERSFSKGNYFSLLSHIQLFSFQTFWRHSDFSVIALVRFINYRKRRLWMTFHQAKDSRTGSFMYLFSISYKKEAKLQFSATLSKKGISGYTDTKKVWKLKEKWIYMKKEWLFKEM